MNTKLPDDLYVGIITVARYSFCHRDKPEDAAAKANLIKTLGSGSLEELPAALRRHGMAWSKDVKGNHIQGENWVTDHAYQLAREVDAIIEQGKRRKKAA